MYFDIGANIGKFSLANVNNTNKIIAIEASPTTYKILLNNTKNINKIECLNYAICNSKKEEITFYESSCNTISTLDKEWLTSSKSRFGNKTQIKSIKVKTLSIDNLIKKYGVPDLIKVDVEGAENIVLKSLTSKTPLLCFEWASEWKDKNIECVKYLYSIGYTKFHMQNEDNYTYRPFDFKNDKKTIIQKLEKATPKKDWGMIWCK